MRAEFVLELQVAVSALGAAELPKRVDLALVAARASEHQAALAGAFLVAACQVAEASAVEDIPAEALAFRVAEASAVEDTPAEALACQVAEASAVEDIPAEASLLVACHMASAEAARRIRASLVAVSVASSVAVVGEALCVSFWASSFLQAWQHTPQH